MLIEGFEVPAPGTVLKGQRIAFGVVQHRRPTWYLVTTDGEGVLGNERRRGGPGVGCGCQVAVSRMHGGVPVRYLFVGGVPDDHFGIPALGFVCAKCDRALRQAIIPMGTVATARTGGPAASPAAAPITSSPPAAPVRSGSDCRLDVVAAMLAFVPPPASKAPRSREPRLGGQVPAADRLLVHDPFALLVGLIAQYGVKAERAWLLPYALQERLGYLDPHRIIEAEAAIATAIAEAPALHRFSRPLAGFIVSAARRVGREYGWDASRIWSDRPTARELDRRFQAFPGMGQKKAMLAIQVLSRDFGVGIEDLGGADVAYDVHIRRVFLRTGLADRDDRAAIIGAARSLRPEAPGDLDLPAWFIGRDWCHSVIPDCPRCPLRMACPKLLGRASAVRGV